MTHKIRKAHIDQLFLYSEWVEEKGQFLMELRHFRKRHEEIVAWLKDLQNNEYMEE